MKITEIAKLMAFVLLTVEAAMGQSTHSGNQLTVEQLDHALSKGSCVLVDARSPDEYNGWALLADWKQGGHIEGAVDFSADWLQVNVEDRDQVLRRVLRAKGITAKKKVIVYSSKDSDRQSVAELMRGNGYSNVVEFDLREWMSRGRKLERYPNFYRLVPPSVVKEILDGKRPTTFESAKRIKVVEASWGAEDVSYNAGHIPGSFHVNTDHFEPPPTWYLGNREVLTGFAKDYGFQADDTVIVYSEDIMAGYRLAIVLEYMGVRDVRVLNGGFNAWKRAGFPIETKRNLPPKSDKGFGVEIPVRKELIIGTSEVQRRMAKGDEFELVDTRTWDEFIGVESGYSYHDKKGRLPGSRYGQAEHRGDDSMIPYRNIDGTMRNAKEIVAMWKASGIRPDRRLCFLCGGGWRAAEVMTYARVMGLHRTELYSDGWIGWSNDPKNPTESGEPR